MTDKEFRKAWYIGLGGGVAIVGAVATLLLVIIRTAQGILANATRALNVANEIVTTTKPIWGLGQTNVVAEQLLEGAQAIREHATELADAIAPQKPAV
ncbi:MAG: hypothetical protein NVSMB42_26210 [Herpetosiphon sp.]